MKIDASDAECAKLLQDVSEYIVDYVRKVPSFPASDINQVHTKTPESKAIADSLREEQVPELPSDVHETLTMYFDTAMKGGMAIGNGGNCAFIPCGGTIHSAVADLISAVVNRFTGVWMGCPGAIQLEVNVLNWICQLIGYTTDEFNPSGPFGCFTSGGSMANFLAIVMARRLILSNHFLDGLIFISEATHACVEKGAFLAGFPFRNIISIPCNSDNQMDTEILKKMIHELRNAGSRPFMIVGNGGSTDAGSVDDLVELRRIANDEKMWFHVDGAYGGFFSLTERGKKTLRGIETADSIALDAHKALFVHNGTGILLVKNRQHLYNGFDSRKGTYLPATGFDKDYVNFCDISPELTRPAYGLRIWLPFKLCGVSQFRDLLNERLDFSNWMYDELKKNTDLEVFHKPQLTVVNFRLKPPPEVDNDVATKANLIYLERINARKNLFLSSVFLRGTFVIRICILHFRTTQAILEAGLRDIIEEAQFCKREFSSYHDDFAVASKL